MTNNCDYSSFKSAVGTSTLKNSYDAGREVAEKTLEKLNDKPDLFLLFATDHYSDNGGFERFLEGAWSILPENTVLAGGTTNGFFKF